MRIEWRKILRVIGIQIAVTTPVVVFLWSAYILGGKYHYAWWDDAWNAISNFFGGATDVVAQQVLDALYGALDAIKQIAYESWNDLWLWVVSAIIFEPHDIYFFALGVLIGLLTTNMALTSTLGILLTVRRIASGWLSGAELAAIGVAMALELIPLGEDLAVLPIVWTILVARTTLWLSLGTFVGQFFKEIFVPRGFGVFKTLYMVVGWIGLILAILDILGFGFMRLIPWARTFWGIRY